MRDSIHDNWSKMPPTVIGRFPKQIEEVELVNTTQALWDPYQCNSCKC